MTTLITLALLTSSLASANQPAPNFSCTTIHEFVATLEFLRKSKALAIPEQDARKIARRVSTGCNGAGQRFIRTMELLTKSGLAAKDSIETASDLALRTDREAETFISVFKMAFLPEYLDLDLRSAMQMARSLSVDFEGDVLAVRDDFAKILEFCVKEKSLDLPRPQCGGFATKIAKLGQPYSGGVGNAFLAAFKFLASEAGPGLTSADALRLAEEIIASGPSASENFILSYRYATSQSGLALPRPEALGFAKNMLGQLPDGTIPPAAKKI